MGPVTVPAVVHYYLTGFGALMIFALGVRLLIGFFHVDPLRPLAWLVLGPGALAPVFLGAALWRAPWFRVGAVLEGVAMTGYLLLVALVVARTDRRRPGLYGIAAGALAGAVAVWVAVPAAFGLVDGRVLAVHRTLVLGGFFPLTIVGYAYQFFPVPNARVVGSHVDATHLTIALLAVGVALQGLGLGLQVPAVRLAGLAGSLAGAGGYTTLLARRFYG